MRKCRYLIIAAIILADQLAKFVVRSNMQLGESVSVIKGFFSITHISNSGGALSMFEGSTLLLIAVPVIAMAAALWYMEKHPRAHITLILAIEFIVGGGIGNLIDRVWQGYVTDFLDFTALPLWNWIFNIADIAVCAGCFLIILYIFAFDKSSGEFSDKPAGNKSEEKNGSAE